MAEGIRIGFLGLGHSHAVGKARVVQASDDWELVAACEPDETVRAARQADDAFVHVPFVSEEELLKDDSIQVVAIEDKVCHNMARAQRAMEAGKHLHLEKPAGDSLPAYQALLELAAEKQRVVQMGYMFRYNTGFEMIRKAVQEDWLGNISSIEGNIGTRIGAETREELRVYPGGLMFELGPHLIEAMVRIFGKPDAVSPFLRQNKGVTDDFLDNCLAVFDYPGCVATVRSADGEVEAGKRRRFEVCGDKGTMRLQPLEPPELWLCLEQAAHGFAAGWQKVELGPCPRYAPEFAELATVVRGERDPSWSSETDLAAHEAILQACGVASP